MAAVFRSSRYANIVSTLALLFALAGTATAAGVTLITGAQVKDGSLTGADIANNSLGLAKLIPTAARKLRGARGPAGPPGQTGTAGKDGATGPAGAAGANGAAGTKIVLAGYTTSNDQTLPDDNAAHTIWSIHFNATANEAFIITGAIGGESTTGCPDGDNSFTEQITLDGTPYSPSGALATFTVGAHTLADTVQGTCGTPGFPVHVPPQQAILIPFALP